MYSSAVAGISSKLRQWFLKDSKVGPMLDLSQAQSLDIRQAINAALEAAGPQYREHYAEWGAVHQHAGPKRGARTASSILNRVLGTVQQEQAATSARSSSVLLASLPLFPNALTTPLPKVPSLNFYYFYGTGLPTERAYHYIHPDAWTPGQPAASSASAPTNSSGSSGSSGGSDSGTSGGGEREGPGCSTGNDSSCSSSSCGGGDGPECAQREKEWAQEEERAPFLINLGVSDPDKGLESGIQQQPDGDVTVPLISLGLMSHAGWRSKRLNPGGVRIVSREYQHVEAPKAPRGGPGSSQHVDFMGNSEMLQDLLRIATGHGAEVDDRTVSRIGEIAEQVDFEAPHGWE